MRTQTLRTQTLRTQTLRTQTTIGALVLVVAFYAVLIGFEGVGLLAGGSLVGQALGVAPLVLPLLGLLLVWREIEFGRRTAALARELDAEGALPGDRRVWFRLALAYDSAGDRTRARKAARHALALKG
jgi:hypothetical protein